MPTPVTIDLKNDSLQLLREFESNSSPALRNQLRNQIVQMNMGLVRREAHHWISQCSESYEDLIQVGCIGLIRAIERFDISKGNAFSSFAIPYIRGEIQHYLRDKGCSVRIPRRWQMLQRQAIGIIHTLQHQLCRQPTDAEVALALEVTVAEWQEIKLAFRNRNPLSLDAPVREDDDSANSLVEMVPDHRYRSFQLAQEDRIRLQQALVHLEKRTREILEFVFLHDLTQRETAEKLGISPVTVSRRVKKGLDTLKHLMMGTDD